MDQMILDIDVKELISSMKIEQLFHMFEYEVARNVIGSSKLKPAIFSTEEIKSEICRRIKKRI